MSDKLVSEAELMVRYKYACRVWQKTLRWEEPFVSYLLGMAVIHLWRELGGKARLPVGLGRGPKP